MTRIELDLIQPLKIQAAVEGKAMQKLLSDVIRAYLKEKGRIK